jgi:hypothetical protein
VRHMHVNARLFPGEKKQAERPVSNDSGCHRGTVADSWQSVYRARKRLRMWH